MAEDHRYSRKHPCSECPFSRTGKPRAAQVGEPYQYIGQICGPFLLSCHMDPGYAPGPEKRTQTDLAQCAGTAIFRSNVGVADRMRNLGLHELPADTKTVFATFAEFLAHRENISVVEAEEILKNITPNQLLFQEMLKAFGRDDGGVIGRIK